MGAGWSGFRKEATMEFSATTVKKTTLGSDCRLPLFPQLNMLRSFFPAESEIKRSLASVKKKDLTAIEERGNDRFLMVGHPPGGDILSWEIFIRSFGRLPQDSEALLPPRLWASEWMGSTATAGLFMAKIDFIDVAEYTIRQVRQSSLRFDIAGDEIPLVIALQDRRFAHAMRDRKVSIVAANVDISRDPDQELAPVIFWDTSVPSLHTLGIKPQRIDIPLERGTLLPVIVHEVQLAAWD